MEIPKDISQALLAFQRMEKEVPDAAPEDKMTNIKVQTLELLCRNMQQELSQGIKLIKDTCQQVLEKVEEGQQVKSKLKKVDSSLKSIKETVNSVQTCTTSLPNTINESLKNIATIQVLTTLLNQLEKNVDKKLETVNRNLGRLEKLEKKMGEIYEALFETTEQPSEQAALAGDSVVSLDLLWEAPTDEPRRSKRQKLTPD